VSAYQTVKLALLASFRLITSVPLRFLNDPKTRLLDPRSNTVGRFEHRFGVASICSPSFELLRRDQEVE